MIHINFVSISHSIWNYLPYIDPGSILGLGGSPGEGNVYPFQYSCLENPMERGTWQATVYGVAEWDRTEQLTLTFHIYGDICWYHHCEMRWKPANKKNIGDRICCRKGGCGESNTQESNELECHTEWSQTEKAKYCMTSFICEMKKNDTNVYVHNRLTDFENEIMVGRSGGKG